MSKTPTRMEYIFSLNKTLQRNKWIQFVFRHNDAGLIVFVDGAIHFDTTDFTITNETLCVAYLSKHMDESETFVVVAAGLLKIHF